MGSLEPRGGDGTFNLRVRYQDYLHLSLSLGVISKTKKKIIPNPSSVDCIS